MARAIPRRLIVTADDFGASSDVNQAVVRAHEEGILTAASLMVAGPAAAEAVEWARRLPRMGVGLHLTLSDGRSVLSHEELPGLVNERGEFDKSVARAGWRYYFCPSLGDSLRREIRAQFRRFAETGLTLDHVNGHQHLHLHPVILPLIMEVAADWGIGRLRLTCDPFWLNVRIASGRWAQRAAHAALYRVLAGRARPLLVRNRIKHTARVFGLLQTGRAHEEYVLRLLERLPEGDSELYSHPSLQGAPRELNALIDPRARAEVRRREIQLIRYQDL